MGELGALVVRWWRSPPWCRATSLSILSFTQFALAAEISATELNVALDSPRPVGRRSHAPTRLRLGTNVIPRSQPINRLEVVATQMDATAATLRATTATPSPRARVIARELGALVVRWWRSPPWCRATSLSILSFTQFALAAEISATELNVALDSPRPAGRRSHAPTHLRIGTTVQARSQPINRLEVVATQMGAIVATLRVTIATPNPRARGLARELGARREADRLKGPCVLCTKQE